MKCYRYSHIAKCNVNPMYRKEPEADLEAEDWGGLSSLSSSSSFPFSSSSSSFLPPPFQLWLEIIGGAPMDFMELGGAGAPSAPPLDPPLEGTEVQGMYFWCRSKFCLVDWYVILTDNHKACCTCHSHQQLE